LNSRKFLIMASIFLGIVSLGSTSIYAQPEGISFDNPRVGSGKLDINYNDTKNANTSNTLWWSPSFRGGFGKIDYNNSGRTNYSGGFLRPFLPEDGYGDLIIGYGEVNTDSVYSYEFQGEYRFPFGLGFGGGFVSRDDGGSDVDFGKVSLSNKIDEWNYVIATQYIDFGTEESGGGYAAAYNDMFMLSYGNDGEQWRQTFGFMAESSDSIFRPAVEVFFVDPRVGKLDGNRMLLANATLKFKGGFLSNGGRLGRAMGPTGVQFSNALGFLSPTWNRTAEVWELGGLMNFRVKRTKTPTETVSEKFQWLIWPFQFGEESNRLDYFYCGSFTNKNTSADDTAGILAGVYGKVSFLQVGLNADYDLDTYNKTIIVQIIDKF